MAQRHRALPRPRLCYVEIPATDARASAGFYESVFGWTIRDRESGRPSFHYPCGDITGAWVTGRAASPEPGFLLYVWVDSVEETLARIQARGGQVVGRPQHMGDMTLATFRDPGGNVVGLHQEDRRPL
ncbi:VOC family protein [bacterium]|nr:VOC family protein [bacterium]